MVFWPMEFCVAGLQPVSAGFAAPLLMLFPPDMELELPMLLEPAMALPPFAALLAHVLVALPDDVAGGTDGPLMLPRDMPFCASAGAARKITAATAASVIRIIVFSQG